jgi:hypothetical protein
MFPAPVTTPVTLKSPLPFVGICEYSLPGLPVFHLEGTISNEGVGISCIGKEI